MAAPLYKRLHTFPHCIFVLIMVITRSFTTEESTAVASVNVEDNFVQIAFHSNPEKVYTYQCSDNFVSSLKGIVESDTISGLGYLVATSRKSGDLQDVAI